MKQRTWFLFLSFAVAFSAACGGGGASSTSTTSNSVQSSPQLVITSNSTLPPALQGHAYSTTLAATGGAGTLHWQMTDPNPAAFTSSTGLTLSDSGVLSGTAAASATFLFTAKVSDSGSPAQSILRTFNFTEFAQLTAIAVPPKSLTQYQSLLSDNSLTFSFKGGIPPLIFSAASMPPGVRMDARGNLVGGPYTTGTYQAMISVQDSFNPPEVVSAPVTVTVTLASLTAFPVSSGRILLNRPVTVMTGAIGGTKPYKFSLLGTPLPAGLSGPDPATGVISGIPTTPGQYNFTVAVTDSGSPPQTSFAGFSVSVTAPLGRNDTPFSATRIGNGLVGGSISPYVDPPNGTPLAADGDYYKLIAQPGSVVRVSTSTNFTLGAPLDTVMEIVDVNGLRLNTCRLPGDTTTAFSSPCLNDDISTNPHNTDSALDFRVPANATPALTFLVHVIDWRGDSRPDMTYLLNVDGAVSPVTVPNISLNPGRVGSQYNQSLPVNGGVSPYTWTLTAGGLPPGLTLDSTGSINGTPTTTGFYFFTLQVTDGLSQVGSGQLSIPIL